MYTYSTDLAENILSIRKADDKQLGEHVLTPPTTPVYTLKSSPLTHEDSAFDDCLYDESEWESAYSFKESVAMWDSVMYEDSNYEGIDMADAFPMLSAIEQKSEPSEFGMNDADSRIVQPTWPVHGREDTQRDVCGGVEEGGGIEGGGDRGG